VWLKAKIEEIKCERLDDNSCAQLNGSGEMNEFAKNNGDSASGVKEAVYRKNRPW
jgi:hypothetical protein